MIYEICMTDEKYDVSGLKIKKMVSRSINEYYFTL